MQAYQQIAPESFWNFTFVDALIGVGAVVAIIVSIYALKVQKSQLNLEGKKYVKNSMNEAFEMMGDDKQHQARERLYQIYKQYKSEHDLSVYRRGDAPEVVETVRRTFDRVGIMFGDDPELLTPFVLAFWPQIIDCWRCIEDFIRDARVRGNSPLFAERFEALYNYTVEFRKSNGRDAVPLRTDP